MYIYIYIYIIINIKVSAPTRCKTLQTKYNRFLLFLWKLYGVEFLNMGFITTILCCLISTYFCFSYQLFFSYSQHRGVNNNLALIKLTLNWQNLNLKINKWHILRLSFEFAWYNTFLEIDRYLWFRFGLVNAINDYLRLKISVVCGGNFIINWIRLTKSESDLLLISYTRNFIKRTFKTVF